MKSFINSLLLVLLSCAWSSVAAQTKVALKASNGKYVCAEMNNDTRLMANRDQVGPWETFEMIDLGNGKVALKADNGKYVCAEMNNDTRMMANRDQAGNWETFERINLDNGNIALKAANGKYVCAEMNNDTRMMANRDQVGNWESFTLTRLDPPVVSSTLVGRWTFAGMSGPWDETENWEALKFFGKAGITSRGLELGKGGWARARIAPEQAGGIAGIHEKTLISWIIIDDLSDKRPAGSALTLDAINKDQFDGIILGETGDHTWIAGSTSLQRTEGVNAENPKVTQSGQLIKMAITYREVGGKAEISIYENDQQKRTYQKGSLPTWTIDNMEVLFGARHTSGDTPRGYLNATIVAAELHSKCLSAAELAARSYKDASSFIRYTTALQAINYPDRYVTVHENNKGTAGILPVPADGSADLRQRATLTLMPGLADAVHVSIALQQPSGMYLTCAPELDGGSLPQDHSLIAVRRPNGTNAFRRSATFKKVPGLAGSGCSFESLAHPGYYLRHSGYDLLLSKLDDSDLFKKDATYEEAPAFVYDISTELPLTDQSWYIISNHYVETKKVLGVLDNGKVELVDLPATGSIDHALWRLERDKRSGPGMHQWRLINKKTGTAKRLDTDGSKQSIAMANEGWYTGQFWQIRPIPWMGSDYFSMTNDFIGEDGSILYCGINGPLPSKWVMPTNLDYVEQRWRFTFMSYVDGVERPALPTRIAGQNCGPNSVSNGRQPALGHDEYANWYPKYGSALGMDYVATEGVSDWALHMARTVLTNVLLGLKDRSQIEKFKNYRILIIGDHDIDVNNYPDFGWDKANEWRGGTNDFVARISEEMMCRTGITNRPADEELRIYDQVVHEFGHTIDMKLGLADEIKAVQVKTNRVQATDAYYGEDFPWWCQAWFDSATPWENGGKRAGFVRNNPEPAVLINSLFSLNREWRPYPVFRRYGQ